MRVEVGEELRGWRWGEPPVAPPPLGVRLSVSDVVGGFCESRRDVYLRRVLRVRVEPNGAVKFGGYIHEVFRRSLVALRRLVEEGVVKGWELLQHFDAEAVAREAAEAAGADPRGWSWRSSLRCRRRLGWTRWRLAAGLTPSAWRRGRCPYSPST
jgi:CRISPR-associated protein Csa1